jgi:hypothetical protein
MAMLKTLILGLAAVVSAGDHPAVKIITLLGKLQTQVKEEGQAEEHAYAKFTYWCSELTKKTNKEIKEAKEAMSVATASIEQLTADIDTLTFEIGELEKSKTAADAAKTLAIDERSKANKAFLEAQKNLGDTIDAVQAALSALESSDKSLIQKGVHNAKSLLSKYSPVAKKLATRFLQADAPPKADGTGRERGYDFKSGDIIEMMKTMKLDFEDQKTDLEKAETEALNAHLLADAAKQQEIDAIDRSLTTKNKVKSAKEADLATAKSDLKDATDAHNTAAKVLQDTTTNCKTRADEWAERSERRAGEIQAMSEAIEVLEKVTGVRTPESKGISLIQLSAEKYPKGDVRKAVVNLLKKAGNTKQTNALNKLADKIMALKQTPGAGVFDQIKNMIQKMIFHLMSEQKDEDDHEAWCAKELDQTKKMEDDKKDRKDAMQADIDQLNAEITSLSNSISECDQNVADIDSAMEQLTATRKENKDENMATIKDAQDAQTAIAQAIAVLTDFYKSTGEVASEAWEFRQVMVRRHRIGAEQEPEPELWEGGESGRYQGTTGGSSVIGLLEDCAADFASMESQAQADETTQESEYEQDITDYSIDKAQEQKDSQMMSSKKDRLSDKLQSKEADFDHNAKELAATSQYWADLQKACVDGDSTYAERKAARTQETEALREAQKILEEAFD